MDELAHVSGGLAYALLQLAPRAPDYTPRLDRCHAPLIYELCMNLKSTTFLRTRQPSEALDQIDERRRMAASTFSVVEGCMGSVPVHFAWSHDLYQSATGTFTVNASPQFDSSAAGSG